MNWKLTGLDAHRLQGYHDLKLMILRLAVIILAATVLSARGGEPAARPSAVRQALIETLGPAASTEGTEAPFPSLIDAMSPEIRVEARARLDALDREPLSAEALTDLSRVYVLLGAHESAARAGLALQRRDPKGTQGLVLAAAAKLEAKDYPSSAALAKQALKIDPNNLDAKSLLETTKGRGVPAASRSGPATALNVAKEPSQAADAVDNRPLRPAGKSIPGQEPPAPINNEPGSPSSGGLPWLPYIIGGTLTVYGGGRSIKHALERGKGALEQTAEKANAGMGDLYFKGKDFVQEHPYATLTVLGGAVLLGGWLILPTLGLGAGGGGLMLATAGGGNVAAAAVASGVGVGALKITAVAAATAAPLLMAGDDTGMHSHDVTVGDTPQGSRGESSSLKKPSAKDPKLQNIIDELFQPGDSLPGGTAGAVRNEILTGRPTGFKRPTFHLKKADYSIRGLNNVLKQKNLSPLDRATAEALKQDLVKALNTNLVIIP